MVFFPWFSLCFCVLDFVAHKDGIKLVWKTWTPISCVKIARSSFILHILLDITTGIYGAHWGSIFHISEPISYEILKKKKKDSTWNKLYLLRKKKSSEICGKGHFETGKANLQWIKQNPKIHRENHKEKWAKQAREKGTLTSTISSARALSRLFSFWPCDEDSLFSTSCELCYKFPFVVQSKTWFKQNMRIEIPEEIVDESS